MITLPVSDSESQRVEMVRSFGLINRPRQSLHDEIASLARDLSGAEAGLVSLVDSERNWFAGVANFAEADQCRWSSFCTHVVAEPDAPLWIEDASLDFRFAANPLVVGAPYLRFYAGVPILVNGHAVGSLCVLDGTPKPPNPQIIARLQRLAMMVGDDLGHRHQVQILRHSLQASADALIDCDEDGIITSWSDSAERLLGFTSAEAVGRKVSIIVPPDRLAAHDHGFDHWRQSGSARLERRIELDARRKDGSLVDIELWMSIAYIDGVRHIHSNIRDISERKRQSAALLAAKTEAEASNLAKSAFLANMSHELRTPLNGVIAVTDILAKTDLTAQQSELTSIIKSSSDQLRRLVGDILDLARIESGELVLTQSPVHLESIVEDVKTLMSLAAQEKGLSLGLELSSDVRPPVLCDGLRLKQVLINLVSNGVKFTEQGSVCMRVCRTGSGVRFEISDTGVGFSEAQRALIFERFQQIDGTITRKNGGSGLGLSISRELVAAMGGDLECSAEPGRGATFWFTLPLDEITEPASGLASPLEETVTIGRVLVVDDNPTNRRVAELLLNSFGADAVCVEDGEQAVEAFLHERFDAILMDMMMPVMDGIAATQAIRRIERLGNLAATPLIMLTANIQPEHIAASLEAGADAHLAKPVTPEGLLRTLASLTENTPPAAEAKISTGGPV